MSENKETFNYSNSASQQEEVEARFCPSTHISHLHIPQIRQENLFCLFCGKYSFIHLSKPTAVMLLFTVWIYP